MADNLDTLTLTTAHAASSYGRPVLVIEGEAYGPGDMTPAGVTGAELVNKWTARFAGQLGRPYAWLDDMPRNFGISAPAARDRAAELAAVLREVWERRASVSERGAGYDVHLDGDLCAAIRAALGETEC